MDAGSAVPSAEAVQEMLPSERGEGAFAEGAFAEGAFAAGATASTWVGVGERAGTARTEPGLTAKPDAARPRREVGVPTKTTVRVREEGSRDERLRGVGPGRA